MTDDSGATQPAGDDASDADGDGADGGDGTPADVSTSKPIGLADAKDAMLSAAEELIDHPIDSVIRIERDGDGWRALVEVVERSAIPDTQDILGRYEIVVDDEGTLVQYGLEERYRRGENREEL